MPRRFFTVYYAWYLETGYHETCKIVVGKTNRGIPVGHITKDTFPTRLPWVIPDFPNCENCVVPGENIYKTEAEATIGALDLHQKIQRQSIRKVIGVTYHLDPPPLSINPDTDGFQQLDTSI